MRTLARLVLVALAAGGLTALGPHAVAAEVVVNTTKDLDDPQDGKCSLREAVVAVHADSSAGLVDGECYDNDGDPDVIRLKPETTYNLTLDGTSDEDDNNDGDLDINFGTFTIRGGKGTTIAQRADGHRVLDVNGGNVTLERVKITGARPNVGETLFFPGAGIQNAGTLTLLRASVIGNQASAGDAFMSTGGGPGGGIHNTGTLTLEHSKVSDNAAGTGGANNGGPSPDTTKGGDGGGIYNHLGTVTILDSKVTNNRAGTGGDGGDGVGFVFGAREGASGGLGGGIVSTGTLTIERSTIADNRSGDGGAGGRGYDDQDSWGASDGGTGGDGAPGGGIYTWSGSTTTIKASTISDNHAGRGGPGGAGGIGTPPGADGLDGAPHNGGGIFAAGSVTVRNVTLSGNTADSGGGIASTADVLLNNVTIARNKAAAEGGGVYRGTTGSFQLNNTIVGDNVAPLGNDCSGSFVGSSNNLIEDTTGCNGFSGTDILSVTPKLGPLADNGGATFTHALKASSPAIDEGFPGPPTGSVPSCEFTDQRGKSRSVCDIGAYEKGGS